MVEVALPLMPDLGFLGGKTAKLARTPRFGPKQDLNHVDDLVRARTTSEPESPFLGYPIIENGQARYVYYSLGELDRFTNNAVRILATKGLTPNTEEKDKVVAMLAPSDIDYVVTLFALVRMKYTVLLLSNRLATDAYVNLLEKTECMCIMGSEATSKSIASILEVRPTSVLQTPTLSEYSVDTASIPFANHSTSHDSNRVAFIIHSSGSTGLPKPIHQTHGACLSNYSNGNGLRALLTLPLFHNHGLSTFFRALYTSTPIALFSAQLPLSLSNLVGAMEAVSPQSFHGVPYALKLLSESEQGTGLLARCNLVLFGGSSCPDELGDRLVDSGVYLVSHYGATEMGQLMASFRPPEDKAWNYVRPSLTTAPFLHFAPREDGLFECVVLDGLRSKVTSNSDHPPNSFHTSDLFVPHSTIPNAWKYVSRSDDRITLVNGEKVLPIPIEHRIRQHELIKEVLMFGVGRALPGLLVVPSSKAEGLSKECFVKQIWPTIASANEKAEGFSQICEEMIEVLDPTIDYPATDKGTIIRAASYKRFATIIDSVYARFEGMTEADNQHKAVLSVAELEQFLLSTVKERTKVEDLDKDTDFFGAGVDSLQAIAIRATLNRHLDVGGHEISQNVLFEFPSVAKLARHLYSLRTGETMELEDEIDVMRELISKYSSFSSQIQRPSEVVLLTGTTGSLGAHILAKLLPLDHVKKVYCLVRAPSASAAMDRVLSTLSAKGLTPFSNVHKIVALPSDLSRADLGLEPTVRSEVKASLTKVIHSAWAVNFNLGVRSFEQQHIKGVHNLINICLSVSATQPAQFFFCSSISAAAGTPLPASIGEAPIDNLNHAQNMGYARSKLVTEKIVQAAAETTGMVAKVFRVGQIVGDTNKGIWNTTEAIPLMIQSAVTMGALPALDETPSWLPVDIVAATILELSCITHPTAASAAAQNPTLHDARIIYNVQNPRVFHWTQDLLPALRSAGLHFDTIPQREWIRRLRESEQDPVKNPTIKLLDFFVEKYDNDGPGRKGLVFRTERTEEASETLSGGVDVVGSGLVEKFVRQWLTVW